MRLFSALDFPPHVLRSLSDRQARLRSQMAAKRWQRMDQVHLTVQFFGEVDSVQLPLLLAAMEEGLSGQESFDLQLGKLGYFPPRRRPRVLWCGLEGELDALKSLEASLWKSCRPWKKQGDRTYTPHITLAREVLEPIDWDGVSQDPLEPEIAWRVEQVSLYLSELSSAGPRYSRLAAFELARKRP